MKCQKCGKEISDKALGYYPKCDDPEVCFCHPCGVVMLDEIREEYVEVVNGVNGSSHPKTISLSKNTKAAGSSGNIWITIAKISVVAFIVLFTVLGVVVSNLISGGAGWIGGIIGFLVAVFASDLLMVFVKMAEDVSAIRNTAETLNAKIKKDTN